MGFECEILIIRLIAKSDMTGFQSGCSSDISLVLLVMIYCRSQPVSMSVLMFASFEVGG